MPTKTQTPPTAEPTSVEPEAELDTPEAVISKRITHTDTGLIFSPDTTFEEWQEAYAFYDRLHERGKWWLGDVIKYAEGKFPDRYTQAIEMTGLSYSRLTTIVSVCSRIEQSRRRAEAPFAYHELIAYLPYQKGDYLLDRAIKEHWNRDELADHVARANGEPTRAEKKAAKEAKKGGTVKVLPPAANPNLPVIDIQTTTTPVAEPPKYVWNGYMLLESGGLLFTGNEMLPVDEATKAAHHFKFNSAVELIAAVKSLESQPPAAPAPAPEPAKAPEAPTPPPVLVEPVAPAQAPAPAILQDYNVASQRVEASINQLVDAFSQLDFERVTTLNAKRFLKFMEPIDIAIDKLSLKIGVNAPPR